MSWEHTTYIRLCQEIFIFLPAPFVLRNEKEISVDYIELDEHDHNQSCALNRYLSHLRYSLGEREGELRSKVNGFHQIDITTDKVFVDESMAGTTYDVITTCLCFEAPCMTTSDYTSAIRNVSKLLKDGGHIALIGALNESTYQVGEFDFRCMKQSAEGIQKMWGDNGFTIVDSEKVILRPPNPEQESDFPPISFVYMLARKGK